MKAYYVHNRQTGRDCIAIPENDRKITVDRDAMQTFIGVRPDFSDLTSEALNGCPPESLGTVIATRDDQGDVCVVDVVLWQQQMAAHLVAP